MAARKQMTREKNASGKKPFARKMDAATVEAYFASLEPGKRAALAKFRLTLKRILPKAEDCISYGIPALRHPDGVVVYYAAMKSHLSFFPTSYPIEACAADLKEYETSRGTIRFPIDTPLPLALVKKLVRVRLEQMAENAPVKAPAKGPGIPTEKAPARRNLNAAWHRDHRMPRNAKPAERAAWHLSHAKACGCREMPASVRDWIAANKTPRVRARKYLG